MGGKQPSDNRKLLAFALPSVVAGLFVFSTATSAIGDRFVQAAFLGFLVPFVGAILAALAAGAAAWLMGEDMGPSRDPREEPLLSTRNILAGILLATAMWLWWQHSKDTTITRVAGCVNEVVAEQQLTPERAVHECYRRASDDDWFSE